MSSSLLAHLLVDDPSAARGENLEMCVPLQWPGPDKVDESFVRLVITRLYNASFRPPSLLAPFALPSPTLLKMLRCVTHIMSEEQNLVDVVVPHTGAVHVFGDLHGDIHSFVEALSRTGLPSAHNLLVFAGDYVDRGPWGIEVFIIASVLKIWRPASVFLLRGNHETSGCAARSVSAPHLDFFSFLDALVSLFQYTCLAKSIDSRVY